MKTVFVLNGPNLNLLGTREPAVYGAHTLADVEQMCAAACARHGFALRFHQSNHEGALVDWIHEAGRLHAAGELAGVVLTMPRAAIIAASLNGRGALTGVTLIEMHISNVYAREGFRHHSFIAAAAKAVMCGFGVQGYALAIDGLPAGAGPHPVMVLLHGGSGSWRHWVRNIDPLLAAGRQLWVPDLPGFGASALPPSGTDADALVAPLHAGLQALTGGQPVDLVGFSFGGMTAGMLLAAYPALAQRLVLVGAPAMGVVPKRQFELKAWRHLADPLQQLEVHRSNLAALMLHDPQQIEGLALDLHVANMQYDRMPRRRLSGTDILARSLPRVTCPVHAIYGRHDVLYRDYIFQLEAA